LNDNLVSILLFVVYNMTTIGPALGNINPIFPASGQATIINAGCASYSDFYQHLLQNYISPGYQCLDVITLFNGLCNNGGSFDNSLVKDRLLQLLPKKYRNQKLYNKLWDDMNNPATFWESFGRNGSDTLSKVFKIPQFRAKIVENSNCIVASQIGDQCYKVLNIDKDIENLITTNMFYCDYCGLQLTQLSNVSGNASTKNLSAACEHLLEALQLLLVYGLTPHENFYSTALLNTILRLLKEFKCYRYACLHCNMVKSRVQTNKATSLFVQIDNLGNLGKGSFITSHQNIKQFALSYFISNGNIYTKDYNLAVYKLNKNPATLIYEQSQINYMTTLLFGTLTSIPLGSGVIITKTEVEKYYRNEPEYKKQANKKKIEQKISKLVNTLILTNGTGPSFIYNRVKSMVDELVSNLNSLIGSGYWDNIQVLLSFGITKIIARICLLYGVAGTTHHPIQKVLGGSSYFVNNNNKILKGGALNSEILQILKSVQNEDARSMFTTVRSIMIIQKFLRSALPRIRKRIQFIKTRKIISDHEAIREALVTLTEDKLEILLVEGFGFTQNQVELLLLDEHYTYHIFEKLKNIAEMNPTRLHEIKNYIDKMKKVPNDEDEEEPTPQIENGLFAFNPSQQFRSHQFNFGNVSSTHPTPSNEDEEEVHHEEYHHEEYHHEEENDIDEPLHVNQLYSNIEMNGDRASIVELKRLYNIDPGILLYLNDEQRENIYKISDNGTLLFPKLLDESLHVNQLYSNIATNLNPESIVELKRLYDIDPEILLYLNDEQRENIYKISDNGTLLFTPIIRGGTIKRKTIKRKTKRRKSKRRKSKRRRNNKKLSRK
jgi:hypothetical protein